ncbi:hypothetical protein RFI_04698 [Reticulomyxa filosa]|uniref:Uncharacterized protein n=1 Tax=Reticulomyxa filosa TaxID=46433 RepID=X6P1L1_RETFI|nr:hypothetical protein RFI_04698 [Reticulomyxa filosa]|eukprot:ETO32420.1 hypothetical protein RFI_04698 [Reticulomyxa filosa]
MLIRSLLGKFVGSIRLTPFLPFGLVTYLISLTEIDLKYIMAGHVTSVFGMAVMAVVGDYQERAERLSPSRYKHYPVLYGIATGLTLATILGFIVYVGLVIRQFRFLQQAQSDALLDYEQTEGIPTSGKIKVLNVGNDESSSDGIQIKYDKHTGDGLTKKKKKRNKKRKLVRKKQQIPPKIDLLIISNEYKNQSGNVNTVLLVQIPQIIQDKSRDTSYENVDFPREKKFSEFKVFQNAFHFLYNFCQVMRIFKLYIFKSVKLILNIQNIIWYFLLRYIAEVSKFQQLKFTTRFLIKIISAKFHTYSLIPTVFIKL